MSNAVERMKAEAAERATTEYRKALRQFTEEELRWDMRRSTGATKVLVLDELGRRGADLAGPEHRQESKQGAAVSETCVRPTRLEIEQELELLRELRRAAGEDDSRSPAVQAALAALWCWRQEQSKTGGRSSTTSDQLGVVDNA